MARLQLLLVDPDLRAQRLTAAGLSRNGFTVTAVASGAEALERLRAHPVDGVLCAASLGGEGTSAVREVLRTLKEGPPFLLLVDGAGAGPSARWEGLAPLDVVSRPVALGDLVARIRAALDAAVRRRLEAGEEEAFQSSVDRMSLLDVVEFFRAQGRSGTVHFSGARDARLVFHAGAPVDAVAGIQSGKEAFFRLLSAREGTYVLRMAETSPEGNLGGGAEALLDEGIAYLEAWDHALEQVPPLSSVLEQDAVRVAEIQGALPEEAGWVLRLVDGERTVEDLVEASTLGGLAVLEILARLYFEGLVSVRKGAAAPTRRPLVDEWLNSPPSLPREPPEAASFRTVAAPAPAPAARTTQSLSREELAAFEEVPAAGEPLSTPGPETAGAPREELNAFAGMTPAEAPAPSARTTQGLSREELAAFADMPPAGAPPATPGTEAEAAPREDLNAFAGMLPAEAPSPSTGTAQGRSREAPSAFAEVTPAAEAPREALGAFAGMTPGPVAAQPQGFVDDGGFPMGSSSAVADPTPFALARGAPPEPVPSGSEGAFPLHFARAPAGAEEPPRPAEGTRETARGELLYDAQPPPPDVPAEPPVAAPEPPREEPLPDTVPPVATGVQEPSPAPSQPAASSQGDDEEFIPVKRNWGFAAVAVGGVLLVGLGAYFGTRTSANTKEPVPPVAVAPPLAAEPVAEQVPEQVPEPDAGGLAAVEPASPDAGAAVAEAQPAAPDAGSSPEAAAAPLVAVAPAQGALGASAAPAVQPPVVQPVAVQAQPAGSASPAPKPVAQAPAADAAPPAADAAPPAPVRPAATKAPAPEFDLSRVTTPPPQGATAQDRVAPSLLPRKTVRTAPVAAQPGAADSAPPGATGAGGSEVSTVLKRARRAQVTGNWKAAVDGYRKAVLLGADTPDVKAGLGISLVSSDPGLRGYQEATELLKQALAQDGGNANAWLSLGMAYQFTGNNAEAVKAYKRYLALAPTGKSAAEVRAMLERL